MAEPGELANEPSDDASKILYEQRKAAGICVTGGCGRKALGDYVYCGRHLAQQRQRQTTTAQAKAETKAERQAREFVERLDAGVCVDCGAERFSQRRCRLCYSRWLVNKKGYTYYDARRAAGLCISCNTVSEDKTKCENCRARKLRNLQQYKQDGRCTCCGEPNDNPDGERCLICVAKATADYAELRRQGICVDCRKRPALPGKSKCRKHQLDDKLKSNRRNAKLRHEVVEAYGGKCTDCPEADPDVLHVHHTNHDGAAHRRQLTGRNNCGGNKINAWLRDEGFPKEGFELLCAKCHAKKTRINQRQELVDRLNEEIKLIDAEE